MHFKIAWMQPLIALLCTFLIAVQPFLSRFYIFVGLFSLWLLNKVVISWHCWLVLRLIENDFYLGCKEHGLIKVIKFMSRWRWRLKCEFTFLFVREGWVVSSCYVMLWKLKACSLVLGHFGWFNVDVFLMVIFWKPTRLIFDQVIVACRLFWLLLVSSYLFI